VSSEFEANDQGNIRGSRQMEFARDSGRLSCIAVAAGVLLIATTAAGQWHQIHKLTAEDAAEDDIFGASVSIDGDLIVIGAPHDDDACPEDPDCDSGAVYVFDAITGEQLHKLTANDASENDVTGASVCINDGRIVAGAPHAGWGAVYIFDAGTGEQLRWLARIDEYSGNFGVSV
jgi:hypothetical protein